MIARRAAWISSARLKLWRINQTTLLKDTPIFCILSQPKSRLFFKKILLRLWIIQIKFQTMRRKAPTQSTSSIQTSLKIWVWWRKHSILLILSTQLKIGSQHRHRITVITMITAWWANIIITIDPCVQWGTMKVDSTTVSICQDGSIRPYLHTISECFCIIFI